MKWVKPFSSFPQAQKKNTTGLENLTYTRIWDNLQERGDFTWSDVWLWRISGGQSQKMMGLKYLAEMTSEELSGIINR